MTSDQQRRGARRRRLAVVLSMAGAPLALAIAFPSGAGTLLNGAATATAAAVGQLAGSCEGGTGTRIDGYRVVLDPADLGLSTAATVDRLRDEGVEDFFVIQSGDHAGLISLGFFSRQSNATSRIAALEAEGFRTRAVEYVTTVAVPECAEPPRPAGSRPVEPEAASQPGPTSRKIAVDEQPTAPGAGPEPPTTAAPPEPPVETPARASVEEAASPCAGGGSSYIVLADPADNGSDVLVLVYKLRAEGVSDLFVVTAEPNKGKVALGIYDDEADAMARVKELRDMGFVVRSEARSGAAAGGDCRP